MDKDEKILERIKNLLDMASDSSNSNEAMIAAKRARALMDKHQISKEDLLSVDDKSFGTSDGAYKPNNTPTWVTGIAGAVAHLNDCQAIICRNRSRVVFQFRGFKSDAIIAKHTHDYLIDTCSRLLSRSGTKGRSEKNFYRLGFAQEINRRIVAIVSERHSEFRDATGKDLIVLKMEMVKAHFEVLSQARKPNIRNPSASECLAAAKGISDAKDVSLNKQIDGDENLQLSA